MKHSLSFSLQLFRKIIYHTQTLTFGVIAALGTHLGVPTLSSGYAKRPLGIASSVHSSADVSGRICLYAYRALNTEPSMHLISISATGILSLSLHALTAIAIVPFLALRMLSDSSSYGNLPFTALAPTLLSRSQPFLSSTSETDSIHSLISQISLFSQSTFCLLP